jgi:hypothetical protein
MNPKETERFLAALDPAAERWTFQTFDDNRERKDKKLVRVLHGTLAEHWERLSQLNEAGAGIFVTVNETDGKGRKKENIKKVRAVFSDLDGAPLEPVLADGRPPHIVIESSQGRWHTYWRVADFPLDQFTGAQKALIELFGGDQSVHDLPRVMRLPGFMHNKSKPPFLVRIVSTKEAPPYKPEDFPIARPKEQPKKLESKADEGSEWSKLNAAALANLAAWVPQLFPESQESNGCYRVTSEMLGRDLQEDLSLTPKGIT